MTENYPIETAIIQEYNKTIALGEEFIFLKSTILNSLLLNPDLHTVSFLDFQTSYDICLNYTNKDETSLMITTKIFAALSLVYNLPKIMITRRSYHKWNSLFETYYSLDMAAFLIHYKLDRFLELLYSFLAIDHSSSVLRHPRNIYFISIFAQDFSQEQSISFLNYSERYLTHYSELIIAELAYKIPFVGRRTPTQDFLHTFIGALALVPCEPSYLETHPLYLRFLQLSPEEFLISFHELSAIQDAQLLSTSHHKAFLTLLFASPFLCGLTFKNGSQYFLKYCDIPTARASNPEYFF